MTTAEADGAVILPKDVIQIQGQEGTVWVVEKGRAPAKRTVRLGISQGSMIQIAELGLRIDRDATSRIEDMDLEEVERYLIKKAIARFDGNVSQMAKALSLSRSALYRRLQRHGL